MLPRCEASLRRQRATRMVMAFFRRAVMGERSDQNLTWCVKILRVSGFWIHRGFRLLCITTYAHPEYNTASID